MKHESDDSSETDGWTAGTATRVITPEQRMWMAGFAKRDKPSQGVVHDLVAKSLALEDADGNRAIVVSVDVLYVPRDLREAVADRCQAEYGLAPDAIMIAATHTHCGPEFRPFDVKKYAEGNVDRYLQRAADYRERLEDDLVDVVGEALDDQAPVRPSYSHARCGFAMNRRLPTGDGIAHVPNPDGPVDHEVPVLVLEGETGPRAVCFGYACHTTTTFGNEFCGDWAGFAQRFLEERYPEATALFLPGCAGDQNPYPRRELELAKQHGRAMANAVRTAVESRRKPVDGPLRTYYTTQTVEFEGPPSRDELEALRERGARYERVRAEALLDELEETGTIRTERQYPVQGFGFGDDLTLIGLGGEPLVEYGLRLKEEFSGSLWVAGYANAQFTYVPTTRAMYEGGYEGEDVIFRSALPGTWKPDLEERILRRAKTVAERVSSGRVIE